MTHFSHGVRRLAFIAAPVLLLTACTAPARISVMGPSGVLTVLAAGSDLERQAMDGDLLVSGSPRGGGLTITRHLGNAAIRIAPKAKPFAVGRQVDSLLAATPYVEWSWASPVGDMMAPPLTVVIGIAAATPGKHRSDHAASLLGVEMPECDYLIVARWRRSGSAPDAPVLHARDATVGTATFDLPPVDTGAWRRGGLDLTQTLAGLWPGFDPAGQHVRYVAVVVQPSKTGAQAYLGKLTLHR